MKTIALASFIIISIFSYSIFKSTAFAEDKQLIAQEEIELGLNKNNSPLTERTYFELNDCDLQIHVIYIETCSVKFKIQRSDITISLEEISDIYFSRSSMKNSYIKFWFNRATRDFLRENPEMPRHSYSHFRSEPRFQEIHRYCDNTVADSISNSESYTLLADVENYDFLEDRLNMYRERYCKPK